MRSGVFRDSAVIGEGSMLSVGIEVSVCIPCFSYRLRRRGLGGGERGKYGRRPQGSLRPNTLTEIHNHHIQEDSPNQTITSS